MKKPNRVSYIFIFTAVFIGVLLVIYVLVGRPVLKYTYGLKAEFEQKQSRLGESQELVRSLPNPQKAISEIKAKMQEFQDLVGSKKQIPRLMQLLGQTASERNITVVSLRPREDIKSDNSPLPVGISKIYLEMVLVCGYQTLADYVKAVNDLPQSFNVESLEMTKEADGLVAQEGKSGSKNPGAGSSGLIRAVLVLSTISGG
jgi:Tfp pilus assembly protein PilO